MDFFTEDQRLNELESRSGSGNLAIAQRVELAWALRQRDGQRARQLADELSAEVAVASLESARLDLVLAEVAALAAEFDSAAHHLAEARRVYEQLGDATGLGDAYLLATLLHTLQGDVAASFSSVNLAAKAYRLAEDPIRLALAVAWTAYISVHAAPEQANQRLGEAREVNPENGVAATLIIDLTEAQLLFVAGRELQAANLLMALIETAERHGMAYFRLRISISLAAASANVEDYDGASAWGEQALAFARRSGWPLAIGDALALLGGIAREFGDAERALSLLEEATRWLAVAPQFRGNAVAQGYLANAELACGHIERAERSAAKAIALGEAVSAWSAVFDGQIAQARVLAKQGRHPEARAMAKAALDTASQRNLNAWIPEAWRAIADVSGDPQASLDALQHALDAARATHDYRAELGLLSAMSQAAEKAGDLPRALSLARAVGQVTVASEQQRQKNRIAALEMHYRTELQQQAAAHQQQLVEMEALRAKELQTSMQVLENLGRIGREITASLDLGSVLHTLVAHLGKLTPANYVGLLVLDESGEMLIRRAVEEGRPLPERRVAVSDPNSNAARCARERREIVITSTPGKTSASHIPGTREMRTAWFGPMVVNNELVGVLSIQSTQENAYGAREQLIFRTLTAYVAVAVVNARSYTRLREQHARLQDVEAEMRKLATTDALTGIPNRRHFLAALTAEVQRSRRNGRPLAVVMADIDHFKRINDRHGHPAGDMVLVQIARVLDLNRRGSDIVGRLGGEEFALLLPETDTHQAAEVADRMRQRIEQETMVWEEKPLKVTMSFGCAELPSELSDGSLSEAASIEAVLQAADEALYEAKRAGRNLVAMLDHGRCSLFTQAPRSGDTVTAP
ncbi:diguanylate cyclase [Chitinimonas sp. BJYL2]|uniref:diguanylate cyclase n=1 Tax=Chitinimonas sp. BJYL2 TaxID=2976696 RepID=UPI0022B43EFB|nr:diguanylate cyclase [Chitinimonas sp. BJYL2]